ncbi:DUF4062 domain-containing protein [Kribbella sp. CA-294648]|uniref:DUF4062 domain-containing protein n=1 Tax=Kribbella sp. CA-294648 TaxID=3239948 RepID=UPI003D8B6FBD
MRVFISSVRRGLESERDALPGLLIATGFEPARFEDFGALPTPSREACVRGVQASDVYLLLLGPAYGDPLPETGQSPTEDEWVAAITKGMPKLVFRKAGIDATTEPRQRTFIEKVGDYASGIFYATFSDTTDLQRKVVEALRRLAAAPSPLTYETLPHDQTPTFSWRDDWRKPQDTTWSGQSSGLGMVELHIVPLDGGGRPGRIMRAISDTLVTRLREFGALSTHQGVEPRTSNTEAVIELPPPPRGGSGIGTTHPAQLRGVRLVAAGQLSVWWTLPGDSMAAILDPDELVTTTAFHLRLAGALGVLDGGRFAIAIGLSGGNMITEGKVTGVARSSVSYAMNSDEHVHVVPDETVSAAAFDLGADEVARNLVGALIQEFHGRR